MSEDNKVHVENGDNTIALVWMIFSIIGLILTATLVFFRIGVPLLVLWLLLWLIGLCKKPRWKARVAVLISLISLWAIAALIVTLRNAMKIPANNYLERTQQEIQNLDIENFDEDKFEALAEEEANNLIQSLSQEELNNLYETSSWTNALEKRSYTFFYLVQQWTENVLNRYKEELPPKIDTENKITEENANIDEPELNEVENTTEDENSTISAENIEENAEEKSTETQETNEEIPTEDDNEVFSDSEQTDIEEIINILQ